MMRRLTFFLTIAAIAFVPTIARADDAGALAETLYQQGRALMAKGSYVAACPKLEESQRLDPGDGTLLALGYCHEGEGKLAQAWSEYTILATKADARHDRAQKAKERRAAIEPRLGRVAIVVPEATLRSAEQIEILRDGTLIGRGAWGTVSPVDPGRHVIEARAPGKKPRRMEVDVRSGESSEVSVAPFEDVAPPARPAVKTEPVKTEPVTTREGPRGSALRTTGVVLGAAGIAATAAGGFFGLRAMQLSARAKAQCGSDGGCSREALATNDDARGSARIANISVVAGLAAVGGGVLFYTLAPKGMPHVAPYGDPSGAAGAVVTTTF